jgi:molybdenum cofactor cytidylyltransferase
MICAIVLAAGRSERMGTQKLLLPLAGKSVITHVVDELSRSRVDEILVITGRDGKRVRQTLADRRVRFVENPDAHSDMLGSVRCGLRGLPANCQAVLLALGDQPSITPTLTDELIHRFYHGDARIVVPACNGHRGHPVLFSSQYADEILTSRPDDGLRGFLDAHAEEVFSVATSDLSAMEDMDTPADYERQKQIFAARYAGTASPL